MGAADGTEDETQAILDTDFQFGVIDKDRDRAHFKETGQLPSDVVTIPHQEYERRKELEIQQNAATNVGPSKPPIHHTNEHNDFVQNGPPKDTVYGHPHQQQIPPRHQQQQHASVPYPYPQDPYMHEAVNPDPLPLDKLPDRIKVIVVRLDEDIAKISAYIQQVALEPEQLNRYQRHLNKLIARRGQYANWWKSQQKKEKRCRGTTA